MLHQHTFKKNISNGLIRATQIIVLNFTKSHNSDTSDSWHMLDQTFKGVQFRHKSSRKNCFSSFPNKHKSINRCSPRALKSFNRSEIALKRHSKKDKLPRTSGFSKETYHFPYGSGGEICFKRKGKKYPLYINLRPDLWDSNALTCERVPPEGSPRGFRPRGTTPSFWSSFVCLCTIIHLASLLERGPCHKLASWRWRISLRVIWLVIFHFGTLLSDLASWSSQGCQIWGRTGCIWDRVMRWEKLATLLAKQCGRVWKQHRKSTLLRVLRKFHPKAVLAS